MLLCRRLVTCEVRVAAYLAHESKSESLSSVSCMSFILSIVSPHLSAPGRPWLWVELSGLLWLVYLGA